MLFRQNIVLCSFFSAGIVATARIPYVTAEPDGVYSFSQVVSNRGKIQSLQLYLAHRRAASAYKEAWQKQWKCVSRSTAIENDELPAIILHIQCKRERKAISANNGWWVSGGPLEAKPMKFQRQNAAAPWIGHGEWCRQETRRATWAI